MTAFPNVPKIAYEGPDSDNPLAFRWYNPDEVVAGKTMRDHLRFTVVYWHTFRGTGSDPFGAATLQRPWDDGSETVENACNRARVAFELFEKLGAPFYAFHDRDVAPEGSSLAESHANLDAVAKVLKEEQDRSGVKLLWGTANLFSNPRYMHGAATSCNVEVFAYAAAQVKKAIEVTQELGGENYVFWGGREGYQSLYNTDMKRELDHLARFFHMAVDHAKQIGFTGQFLIEPKPKEPIRNLALDSRVILRSCRRPQRLNCQEQAATTTRLPGRSSSPRSEPSSRWRHANEQPPTRNTREVPSDLRHRRCGSDVAVWRGALRVSLHVDRPVGCRYRRRSGR